MNLTQTLSIETSCHLQKLKSNRVVHNLNFQTVIYRCDSSQDFINQGSLWPYNRVSTPKLLNYTFKVVKKTLSTLTVPPLSTWNINVCFPLASAGPLRYLTFFKSVGSLCWISLAHSQPCWVSAVPKCSRGLRGFLCWREGAY